MRTLDFSPLMRSAIGFDDLFRMAERNFTKGFENGELAYPPYNIEKLGKDGYRITMALAGFGKDDITVTLEDDTLSITGKTEETEQDEKREFIHRGIATRAFARKFQLADTIRVAGASFDNGLLHVDLKRVIPEHKRPREIPVEVGKTKAATIEGKKAKTEKAA